MFGLRRTLRSRLQRNFQNHGVRASILRNLGSPTATTKIILAHYPFWSPPQASLSFRLDLSCCSFNAPALYMLRSNVLRLRKCSSAGGLRHGVARRLYSSEKSLSITEEEFNDALGLVLAGQRSREGNRLRDVGVKVPIGMRGVDTEKIKTNNPPRPRSKRRCGLYGTRLSLCSSPRRKQSFAKSPWLRCGSQSASGKHRRSALGCRPIALEMCVAPRQIHTYQLAD